MREVNQKYWDAMIIRSWNKFESCTNLSVACYHEFGDYPQNLNLKRNTQMFGGVRAWVAAHMPELSEKLWNVPKEKQVDLLNWLQTTKIDVQKKSRKTNNYGSEAHKLLHVSNGRMNQKLVSGKLQQTLNRNNMWQVVK